MNNSQVAHIKRSQKESLLLKELSKMLHQLSLDDKELEAAGVDNKIAIKAVSNRLFGMEYCQKIVTRLSGKQGQIL